MKRLHAILLLLMVALFIGSCKKKEKYTVTQGDFLIVGRLAGFTTADARTKYYHISTGALKKDTTQLWQAPRPDISKFKFDIQMPEADYAKVANLPASIPAELLSRNNATIGTMLPDAGYTDVLANINGISYRWSLEANMDNESSSIRQFAQRFADDLP